MGDGTTEQKLVGPHPDQAKTKELRAQGKKIMRIPTDSRPLEDPKDPDQDHLYQLYSLFADDSQKEQMAATYRRGGFGYGEIKKQLVEVAESFFAEARERRATLEKDADYVSGVLEEGAKRARAKASVVLARAQKACGMGL